MYCVKIQLSRERFAYYAVPGRLNGLMIYVWNLTRAEYQCDRDVRLFLLDSGTLIVYGSDVQIDNIQKILNEH